MRIAEQAERNYARFVDRWKTRPDKNGGASASIRQGPTELPGGACSRHTTLRYEIARARKIYHAMRTQSDLLGDGHGRGPQGAGGFRRRRLGPQVPAIAQSSRRNWEHVIPFFAFSVAVRRVIYTMDEIDERSLGGDRLAVFP